LSDFGCLKISAGEPSAAEFIFEQLSNAIKSTTHRHSGERSPTADLGIQPFWTCWYLVFGPRDFVRAIEKKEENTISTIIIIIIIIMLTTSAYLASAASTTELTSSLLQSRLRDIKDSNTPAALLE